MSRKQIKHDVTQTSGLGALWRFSSAILQCENTLAQKLFLQCYFVLAGFSALSSPQNNCCGRLRDIW